MVYGVYYETQETQSFVDVIRANVKQRRQQAASTASLRPMHAIDVGGDIGCYTLVAVAAAVVQIIRSLPMSLRQIHEIILVCANSSLSTNGSIMSKRPSIFIR